MTTTTGYTGPSVGAPPLAQTSPRSWSTLPAKLDALRGLSMFASVPNVDLVRLAEPSEMRNFSRGQAIHSSRDTSNCVFLVRGRAKTCVARGASGGAFVVALVESGDLVSHGCWGREGADDATETIALETTTAMFLPRDALDACLQANPRTAVALLSAFAAKLQRLVGTAARTAGLEVSDRLYRKLVELSSDSSLGGRGEILIEHGLYQAELAASIGASREAVNRQLSAWRELGLVEPSRRSILIKDPKGLAMAVSHCVRAIGFGQAVEQADRH